MRGMDVLALHRGKRRRGHGYRLRWLASLSVVFVIAASCTGGHHTPPARVKVSVEADSRVTRDDLARAYARYDGGTDSVLKSCSGSRFPQNEPSVAIDPHQPQVIVVGANEYCPAIGGRAPWVGFYRSTDGGSTWAPSLVPGYPGDRSALGKKSPGSRFCSAGSDPAVAFDRQGRLFFGFVCIDLKAFTLSTLIASYDQDGAHYLRTAVLVRGRGSRGENDPVAEDKINVVVDQTTGPTSGTVYAAWTQFAVQRNDRTVLVANSTDHGATFSSPVVATGGQPGLSPDLAIGPTGRVCLSFRNIPALEDSAQQVIEIALSPNAGRTFTAVATVATITPFDSQAFSGGGGPTCGDGPFKCRSGFTFPRFFSSSAVAADNSGVHVVWAARLPDGQSKVFVRNSPDGIRWTTPPQVLDPVGRGDQFFPDVASAGGVISVVFYDTRGDAGYAPDRPPGNDAKGRSTGNVVDVYAAVSADGGTTWTDHLVTSQPSNMGYEWFVDAPFFGDYLSVSALAGTAFVVWTDTRDLRPGSVKGPDGFDVAAAKCRDKDRACLAAGSLDQNIYGAALRVVVVG